MPTPRKKQPKPQPRPNERQPGKHIDRGRAPRLDSNTFQLICERYAETGLAIRSCEDLGYNYHTVNEAIRDQWNHGDRTWREAWEFAREKFNESLDAAIIQRGRDGTPTKFRINPKTGVSEVIERTYSDRMLELAAKAHNPNKYREKLFVSGTVGLEPVDVFSGLSYEAKRRIRDIIREDLEKQRLVSAGDGELIEGEARLIEDQQGLDDDD